MRAVDIYVDQEGEAPLQVDEDYELIGLACRRIYGIVRGRRAAASAGKLLGPRRADAMWWRFKVRGEALVVRGQTWSVLARAGASGRGTGGAGHGRLYGWRASVAGGRGAWPRADL